MLGQSLPRHLSAQMLLSGCRSLGQLKIRTHTVYPFGDKVNRRTALHLFSPSAYESPETHLVKEPVEHGFCVEPLYYGSKAKEEHESLGVTRETRVTCILCITQRTCLT